MNGEGNSGLRVSIGLPVRNGERYLAACMRSLLSQTLPDIELIICDNASDDRTEEIARSFAKQDARVRFYRWEQNIGAAANFNRVFEYAQGRYFKWAAYDDVCARNYLERCVQVLDNNDQVVLCHCVTGCIDADNTMLGVYPAERSFEADSPHERFYDIVTGNHYCLAVFGVIRTDALRGTGLIGPFVGSDRTLLAELGLKGKIHLLSDCLFLRRDHPETTMRQYPDERQRLAWFDPSRANRMSFPTWRRLREYFAAVRRVKMPLAEKRRCYAQVLRWMGARHHTGTRNTSKLWEDLQIGFRMAIRRDAAAGK